MTLLTDPWTETRSMLRSDRPLELTIGAASPLWFLFAGAAATGAAYWWMRQWVQPMNLEAMMGEPGRGFTPAVPAPTEPRSFEPTTIEDEPAELQIAAEPAFSAPAMEVEPEKLAAEIIAEPATAVAEALKATIEGPAPAAAKGKGKKAAPPSNA